MNIQLPDTVRGCVYGGYLRTRWKDIDERVMSSVHFSWRRHRTLEEIDNDQSIFGTDIVDPDEVWM
jgi:hypothetical protein